MTVLDSAPLPRIREHNEKLHTWLVVLDDDPTGAQAVHDVAVLVDPTGSDLLPLALARTPTFVWTNTRSLPPNTAAEINHRIVRLALDVAGRAEVRPVFVSRSDSTLRGHFSAELGAINAALHEAGRPVDGMVFVPAFLEAGRYTADDVHWVRQPDGTATPAAHTEFARDATFGYREENLRDWVAARTDTPASGVRSISLTTLRTGAADRVLRSLSGGAVVIGNATEHADLEALALACHAAERAGRHLIYRTGPSFVRALAGQPRRAPLTTTDLHLADAPPFGLTVIGSHTALTTRQLDVATRQHHLTTVELDVDALLDGRTHAATRDTATALAHALRHTHTALITSRTPRVDAAQPHASLTLARHVSTTVCDIIANLPPDLPLRYVIAKGGITSHDVAAHGLRTRHATVLGQLFPGQVSVLRLGEHTRYPGTPYVVFPGNVGTDDSLATVLSIMDTPGRAQNESEEP